MRKLALLLATVLMASAGSALAQAFLTTVGSAVQDGSVQFQLVSPDGSSLNVQTNVSAGDSSSTIAGKIRNAVNSPVWQAQVNSGALAFMHYTGSTWTWIGVILNLRDSSCSSLSVTPRCPSWFSLTFDAGAVASGTGPMNGKYGPSYLTFSVAGTAPYTVTPHPGQSVKSLMDGICAYLTGAGISYTRETDTKIKLGFSSATASFQTNDSGLQGSVALGDAWDVQSGLIDR
jgi:hypothetical protein